MANKKGGLGRGLSALLPQTQSQYSQIQPQDTVHDIQVSLIQPNRYQPRREFDANALNELAESIKSYGILQPIIVRKIDSGYELIAGERRLRASKIVGLENIPAIIREYTDAQMSEISIIENVQRENLNVIEEAQAYDRLIKEFGHTQEVVAAKIGRSRSHISNIMRLLKLSPTVRALIAKGLLTLGQARPLLAIENEVIQVQAAEMILSEGLSVRKVEAFINELKNSG
ncbi:MAG: ParB/RepB/Spo0J family partition protein, partial [Selenomonadaceae bacterium]|nr:ParB/RepB/Spo0J family partition protein [Selenomonadaceae bacterium]